MVGEVFVFTVAAVRFSASKEDGGATFVFRNGNDGKINSANAADALNDQIRVLAVFGGVNYRIFGNLALAKLERGDRVAVVVKEFNCFFKLSTSYD